MTNNERDKLKRAAAGAAMDELGKDEFVRRVDVASRLVNETLASHLGDGPLAMLVGLTALEHVTECAMQDLHQITSAAIAASREGREN